MFQPTYIEHKGKRILRLDYGESLTHAELLQAFLQAGRKSPPTRRTRCAS
ncbi:MAG: hypothetical protein QM767_04045 [Anaeromyxobacter sp.]